MEELLEHRHKQHIGEIPQDCAALHIAFGTDIFRRDNLHLVDPTTIAYTIGNSVVFHDIITNIKTYVQGLDSAGVGCVCIHPHKDKFAMGGVGYQPRIFVYAYPSIEVQKKLVAGAERGYASLSFNATGTRLVSVSTSPDYMLTVWDWENERIILHAKAFGQDVFSARFSLDMDGRLTTSGTGHIRFWKMASTFTGQKLQGLIGKFGKVELSDIAAFVEFPDGKVLSGTETGALLLWEGNFIKSRLVRDVSQQVPCHEGEVNFLALDHAEGCVISAGIDGFICIWDFREVDIAESQSDSSVDVAISPLAEYSLGPGVGIRALVDTGRIEDSRFFILLDSKGRFVRLSLSFDDESSTLAGALTRAARSPSAVHVVCNFHAGAITGMDTCPSAHVAATCGADGLIKCWDYVRKDLITSYECNSAATCLRWAPRSIDASGRTFVVGFADGIIRRFVTDKAEGDIKTIVLVKAYKPHNASVTDLGFSAAHNLLFTSGGEGIVFAFKCRAGAIRADRDNWLPLLFVTVAPDLHNVFATKISAHASAMKLLCSCTDGIAREIDFNEISAINIDSMEEIQSYEKFYPIKNFSVRLTRAAPVVEDGTVKADETVPSAPGAEEEVTVPNLQMTLYAADAHPVEAFVATDSELSQVFQCSLLSSKPIEEIRLGNYSSDGKTADRAPVASSMRYSSAKKFLLMGASDGSITVRHVNYMDTFLKLQGHGRAAGGVSCVATSFDDSFLLSAGHDGTFVVHRISVEAVDECSMLVAASLQSNTFGGAITKPYTLRQSLPRFINVVSSCDLVVPGFKDLDETDVEFPVAAAQMAVAPIIEADIDSSSYSIQDAKLKSELDAKRKVAEELKSGVRVGVVNLRSEFNHILNMNAKIPPEVRLTSKELEIDCEYFQFLHDLGTDAVQEVHKECAYELEKTEALCKKLRSRLMDNILIEEMPLRCLDPTKKRIVYSLRVRGVDNRVQDMLDMIEAQVKSEQLEEAKNWAAKAALKKAAKTLDEMQKRATNKKDANAAPSDDKDEKRGYTSAAVRRDLRKQRKATIEKHNGEKPNKDDDDIQDLEAIQVAQRTMGDYKLKCADEYEVPEDQRINAQDKKRQLALLEESTVAMRLRFNQRFLSMRQLKRQMIYNICQDNARIREINEELKEQEKSKALWEPQFDPLEYPDDRFEVTAAELAEYAASRKGTVAWKDSKAPVNKTITGIKTYISNDPLTGRWTVTEAPLNPEQENEEEVVDNTVLASNRIVLNSFLSSANELKRLALLEAKVPCLKLAKDALKGITWLENEDEESLTRMKEDRKRSLIYERKVLMEKTTSDINNFDDALDDLRLDRHTIVSDLKLAELKLLVLYQEYELLLTFEAKDIALQQKQLNYQRDKSENFANINDHQNKLNIKVEDLKQWNEKVERIVEEYRELILDTNPSAEILGKIFKKKIKRAKATDGDESEDDYDDDDYDEEEEEVEDMCPPGCELHFYESVLELRERRLDAEDSMGEVQKRIDELKKTIDRFKQREKQIDKDLKQTGAEIQQFQQQKQAALNKIDVVVPLKVSQLYTFETSGQKSGPGDIEVNKLDTAEVAVSTTSPGSPDRGGFSSDSRSLVSTMSMQSHVLIKRQVLHRLRTRVEELISECNQARVDYRALHKDRSRLEKAKDIEQSNIEMLSSKAVNLQLHKFGRIVDLDTLEGDAEDANEDPAEVAARLAREQNIANIEKLEHDSDKLKDKLADVTKVNTDLLLQISKLLEEKAKIVSDLKAPGTDVLQDNSALMQEEEEATNSMIQLVSRQSREIEAMKAEILNLKRKETSHMVPALPIASTKSSPGLFPPIPNKRKTSL